jgi:hypothetical protein
MIIAVRFPTGAPPELQVLFRDFLGTADAVRKVDIADEEKRKDVVCLTIFLVSQRLQIFGTITEWLSRSDGNQSLPNVMLLLCLPPTYEVELIALAQH